MATQNGTLEFKDGYVQECPTYGNTPDPNIRTRSRQAFRLYTYVQLATKQRGVRMHRPYRRLFPDIPDSLSLAADHAFIVTKDQVELIAALTLHTALHTSQ
ncbi:hypothetical protein ABKN59_001313 [Abortiporus biennis]